MSGRDLVDDLRTGAKPMPRPARASGPIDLLIAVAAVVALGAAGYFGINGWFGSHAPGSSPPPQAETPAVVSTAAHVTPAQVVWTADDEARCKTRAIAAANAPVPGELALANPAVTPGFAGMATMLECRITTKRARFCDSAQRGLLVAAVNDYLTRSEIVVAGMGLEGAPMAAMGYFLGGEVEAGSGIYEIEHNQTLTFMESYNVKVTAALKSLARDGLVAPSDFAGLLGGVPENIKRLFGDVQAQRNVCA